MSGSRVWSSKCCFYDLQEFPGDLIEKVMSFEGKSMNGNHGRHISLNKCDQRACRVEGRGVT